MKKTLKKTLAILVAILMIVTTIPMAFAAEGETRTIYVKEEITGFNFGYEYWFIDADENGLDCSYEDLGDNWYKYTVPVSAAKYYMWKGIGGGDSYPYEPIPEKVDTLINRNGEAEWYCSHNMETSGEQTCKGFICEICGETYGESDLSAHKIKDGICEVCGEAAPDGPLTIDITDKDIVRIGEGYEFYDKDGYILTGTNEETLIRFFQSGNLTLSNLNAGEINFNYAPDYSVINITLDGKTEIEHVCLLRQHLVFDGAEADTFKSECFVTSGHYGSVTVNGGNIVLDCITESASPTISCRGGLIINGGTVTASNNYFYVVDSDVTLNGGKLNINSTSDDYAANESKIIINRDALLTFNVENEMLRYESDLGYLGNIVMADDAEENNCFFVRYDTASDFVLAYDICPALDGKTYAEIKIDTHEHSFDVASKCVCGFNCPHESIVEGKCDDCGAEGEVVTITMTDRYGDSWSGNAIAIEKLIDGVYTEVARATNVNGGTATYNALLDKDGVYVFKWIQGSYSNECSFVINVGGEDVYEVTGADVLTNDQVIYIICPHKNFVGGKCDICGTECPHESIVEGKCDNCGIDCPHKNFVDDKCSDCGAEGEVVTITMTDSYGDGWNGNAIVIEKLIDGVYTEVASATFENGDTATYNAFLDKDGNYVFKWIQGSFSNECSFVINVGGEDVYEVTGASRLTNGQEFYRICAHKTFTDGKCDYCDYVCTHETYTDGVCDECGYECDHAEQTGTCTICGMNLHICDFTGEWKHDSENHWKECTCGAKEQIASHEDTLVQAEAKAPTCSAAGYEAYEYCTACDYTTYEELPKEIFHKDADKNNKCDDCSAELAFEINRNGELLYYDNPYIQGFQALYDAAQDGDVITLLRDVFAYTIEIRKELTYDLNGFNIITASSRSINIYDNVTIRDSVGGGEIYLAVYIGAPCTIEGGIFNSLGVASGITLDSILSPCAGYYDYKGNAIDTTGKTSIDNAYVIENHTEGDIYNCLGYKCAVCDKYYGEPNPDGHAYTEGVCDLCGYDCPHTETYETVTELEHFSVQNPDGTWTKATVGVVCRKCYEILEEKEADRADYTEFDEIMAKICEYLDSGKLIDNAYNDYSSTINIMKNNPDIIGSPFQSTPDGYIEELNRMLSKIEAGIADGTMVKADFTYMTSLFDEINALIDNDPNKLIPSESGRFQGIYYGYYMSCKNNGNHSQFDYDQNMAGNNWDGQIEAILAGVKDGTALKADYTEIDEAIAKLDEKLADENLTDEAKAGLEEIKADLEEMKKNSLSSKADLAELEKALEEYETELDAGIEDGTAVEVDGIEILLEYQDELRENLIKKYGEENYNKLMNSTTDEVKEKAIAIEEAAEALTGTVAENAEKIAEIKASFKALFDEAELCLAGTHSYTYEEISPAKCGENAIEEGTCRFCGEVLTREVENSALTHSFTDYVVVEAAACDKAGKEVAECDHGCGATDEKEIPAREHLFLEYIYNDDATCEADGTNTAVCVNGCGETHTVTAEDTKLSHADEDGDRICDDCEIEIAEICPDCGGPVHEGEYAQYICMLRIIIKLMVSLIKTLSKLQA